MHPTDSTFFLYVKNQDFFTSIASKIMSLYQNWLDNGVKTFSLQFNFLRPSIYDLKTDEYGLSFLALPQKASHHQTYTKFLQHTKPQNYLFVNYKYTSPFNLTHLYTIDHARITDYIRKYDPIKQYFCLLPFNDTSRPLFVPQEYLLHFDDFLLPCNIPTQIVKPLTVIIHLVSSSLDDNKNHVIPLLPNNRTHITNCPVSQPKLFQTWYKQNTKQKINHLLLNIPHLFEILLKNFHQ